MRCRVSGIENMWVKYISKFVSKFKLKKFLNSLSSHPISSMLYSIRLLITSSRLRTDNGNWNEFSYSFECQKGTIYMLLFVKCTLHTGALMPWCEMHHWISIVISRLMSGQWIFVEYVWQILFNQNDLIFNNRIFQYIK